MSMVPGATLGPYRVVEQIGRGGMATVYKAYQAALARYVAIKVLPAFFAEDIAFRERFQQEAIAIAKLRHPNILLVFDYGEEGGVTYLVSEFIDGGTLAEQIGAPLPLEYTTGILLPIASALDYAHARNILHRDVKPSNILLAHDGTPVLSDFGLAKIVGSIPRLTRTGMTVGTPEYMAPEQGMAEGVGPSADHYALAVVAYEMLTGRVPFSAETPLAVLLAHLHKPLPLPRTVNPALPEAVEAVLLKGLAKSPDERYPTATEFVSALIDATNAQPAQATPTGSMVAAGAATIQAKAADTAPVAKADQPEATTQAAPASQSRRVQPVAVLIAAVLALVLGGGAFAILHNHGGSQQAQGTTPTPTSMPSAARTGTVAIIAAHTAPAATNALPTGNIPRATSTMAQAAASQTLVVAVVPKSPTTAQTPVASRSVTVTAPNTPIPTAVRGPFSTAAGSWAAGGAVTDLGANPAVVTLADGRLLAMGGYDPNSTDVSAATLYDPTKHQWTPTGSMHVPRQYFTATLLRDGRVLVAGGDTGRDFTATAELYDPAKGTWTVTGQMHTPRGEHLAALLPDGTVLVAGGQGPNYEPLISAEIYDPAMGAWHAAPSTNSDHIAGVATVLSDGRVLVAGGDTRVAEIYLPRKQVWEAAGNLSVIRSNFTGTLLSDGRVLAVGGENPDTTTNTTWTTAEVYDPASNTWTPTGAMATPRVGHTTSLLPDGRVLTMGGKNGHAALASAEVYDPATGRWATAGNMHEARVFAVAAVLGDGTALVLSGFTDAGMAGNYEVFRPVERAPTALLLAMRPVNRAGPDGPDRRYFPQTHHQLAGPFLHYWNAHLGVIVLGLPITEPIRQAGTTAQYCERGLLRLASGAVTLAPLGKDLTAGRHFTAAHATVAAEFAQYYARHQGPHLFGAPLAPPDYETNGDGSGRRYLVQWFEHGRLEYHPETPARFRVLPGLVGKQALQLAEHG